MALSKEQQRQKTRLQKAVDTGRTLTKGAQKAAENFGISSKTAQKKKVGDERNMTGEKKTVSRRSKEEQELEKLNRDNPLYPGAKEAVKGEESIGDPKTNEDEFLQILATVPESERGRYLSAYQEFRTLPVNEQKKYLNSFEEMAKKAVAPAYERKEKRLNEDFEYNEGSISRQKQSLQQTFEKIVGEIDFNVGRDIAKTNRDAASAIQNVTNTAFVTGVAGSGIFKRRSSYVNEAAGNRMEDINIGANQQKSRLELQKGQQEQRLDAELARMQQLMGRDVFDMGQNRKEDEAGLFFDLVGSDMGEKGYQYGRILESDPTASMELNSGIKRTGGSAEEDFMNIDERRDTNDRRNVQNLPYLDFSKLSDEEITAVNKRFSEDGINVGSGDDRLAYELLARGVTDLGNYGGGMRDQREYIRGGGEEVYVPNTTSFNERLKRIRAIGSGKSLLYR